MRMRSVIIVVVLVLLALVGLVGWPLLGLYQVVDAVRSRDAAAFERRVDLPAVQRSIAMQFLDLAARGEIKGVKISLDPAGQEIVTNLIAARLEAEITPEIIFELLRRGTLGEGAPEAPAGAGGVTEPEVASEPPPYALPANPLSRFKGLGFPAPGRFRITLGEGDDPAEWLTLTLTLASSFIWRVTDVDLPDKLFRRLQRDIRFEIGNGGS
jgi:hypothetical protein